MTEVLRMGPSVEAGPIGGVPRLRVRDALPAEPQDAVGRVRRALTMLREPTSAHQLESRVPSAVRQLGFDRGGYARVSGLEWRPAAWDTVDPPAPTRLDESFAEYRAVMGRAPAVVLSNEPARAVSTDWCRTYVAAPVVDRGAVVGMVHAGHRVVGRRPTPQACEAVWALAEALTTGFVSVRAGDTLRDLMARMSEVADDLGRCSPILDPTFPLDATAASGLTYREREVLELMAAGQTNAQIARRLVIAEGTAKSHVKRIMRKLSAANRAEAVAAWLRYRDRSFTEGI